MGMWKLCSNYVFLSAIQRSTLWFLYDNFKYFGLKLYISYADA